ncbi:electron transfer flavoprotein alpha subunit [Kineosphaera limosa]|uniref:Electron transfer flavoprotein subunit alpha n=1 Tax=Kineosphaera limosa NBRC 100340 TaxID=1184609 RepID=K6XDC5_9MICO|nr:electron transfer flavoprotein subunit alpha/FixB family protein [Kineosphaera limosa]NYE00705.1 electron transfer flavoprotein alpha subunit [Kineosphaera limosa]GAB96794.1 electron transfer flavoprotein subunit alpha [Kineosphaera limosa NBRC 100340]
MSAVVVFIETDGDQVGLVSQETLTFARQLGDPVYALVLGSATEGVVADCREQGVAAIFEAANEELGAYSGAAWGAALGSVVDAVGDVAAVVAGGTPRGNEVLAHLAARKDLPMAANVVGIAAQSADGLEVERQVVGGAAIENASLTGGTPVLTVAGHALEPAPADAPGGAAVLPFAADLTEKDLRARVARVQAREGGDTSALTGARIVVGAGRGAGGPDGFGPVDALASRLGGSVGVSRVVTSLGWRPHHEQVGQTGSRISPDLYIACGISGAIQHWAGCSSSKTIIAINTDGDAPMVTKANYAVVGDMHEVLPALLDQLK